MARRDDDNETPDLLEREGEIGLLAEDVSNLRREIGNLTLITGPAGIGKSALLDHVQREAERARMSVLRARCIELEQGFAFGVVRQLLGRVLIGREASERARLLSGPARVAGALLDEGELNPAEPTTEDRTFTFLHGLYALVVNLAERGPIVLVVDDVHWADSPSLRWLSYLAGRLETLAVMVVVTSRDGDPSSPDPSLTAIAAESATRVMSLKPLSPAATSVLVEREFGAAAAPEFRAACHSATGGNPFFLGELFRALHDAGVAPTAAAAADVAGRGPATLARSVLLRTAGLSAEARALAVSVAVLGADAELQHAAALADLDDATAADAASRLMGAKIIQGVDRLSFVHPIVRSSIYADVPVARRALAHARAARLLSASGVAAERASAHLLLAVPAGDPWVVQVLDEAAGVAMARGAPESAVRYLGRALAEPPPPSARHSVLARLGWAEYLAYDRRAAVAHLIDAMQLAQTTHDRHTVALQAATVLVVAGDDLSQQAVDILDRAITEIPDDESHVELRLKAQLIAAAGLKLATRPRQREWVDRADARAFGDTPAERLLLAVLVCMTVLEGRVPGRFPDLAGPAGAAGSPAQIALELSERVMGGGRLLEEEGPESHLFYSVVIAFWVADWVDRAAYWLGRAINHARRTGSAVGFALASGFLAEVAYRTGDLHAAEAHARAAMGFAPGDVTAVLVNTLIELGRTTEAAEVLAGDPFDPNTDHLMLQPVIAARARLLITEGRRPEGADGLAAVGAWLERWPIYNPGFVPWRSALAAALSSPEDRERARQLAREEVEHARALGQARSLGVALRVSALLEGRCDAIDLLREATSVLEASQSRLEFARALTDLGAALRRNGNRVDCRAPLREGLDIAHRCGATTLAEHARAELLATGARPRRTALSGRDALTASERRVADMATDGLTTAEIAQALFVTTKTVETHLGHVYQKLHIHSRKEIADALTATVQ